MSSGNNCVSNILKALFQPSVFTFIEAYGAHRKAGLREATPLPGGGGVASSPFFRLLRVGWAHADLDLGTTAPQGNNKSQVWTNPDL